MVSSLRLSFAALLVMLSSAAVATGTLSVLRVCADPGNMPFSNQRGEGFENRIAHVIADALGASVQYYFRPGIERGMTRTTLGAEQCDVMLDLTPDAEGVMVTSSLYRSTFVLVTRKDRALDFKSLDDDRLKTLKVGVYQTSAIRDALAEHGVQNNTVVHYLSHDADLVAADEPVTQVQQVVDGQLDVAAIWGPFAGYFLTLKHAPLVLEPANVLEESVPLEFDMALAVRTQNRALRDQIDQVLRQQVDKIHAILVEFGVPLVNCDSCLIHGELPSHGPYAERKPKGALGPASPPVTIAMLEQWLQEGAKVSDELSNGVIADDLARVSYLIEKRHADVNARDLQGYPPLHHSIRRMSLEMANYLIAHKADVNRTDSDGWTPLMTAAWVNDGELIRLLAAHQAVLTTQNRQGLTALGIAAQYGKDVAVVALLAAGSHVDQRIGSDYTPLMLAVVGQSSRSTKALIDHGANVNARNSGGVTALMIAAASNQEDLAALLIQSGADTSATNENGQTALGIAQDKDSQAVIKLLAKPAPSAT